MRDGPWLGTAPDLSTVIMEMAAQAEEAARELPALEAPPEEEAAGHPPHSDLPMRLQPGAGSGGAAGGGRPSACYVGRPAGYPVVGTARLSLLVRRYL